MKFFLSLILVVFADYSFRNKLMIPEDHLASVSENIRAQSSQFQDTVAQNLKELNTAAELAIKRETALNDREEKLKNYENQLRSDFERAQNKLKKQDDDFYKEKTAFDGEINKFKIQKSTLESDQMRLTKQLDDINKQKSDLQSFNLQLTNKEAAISQIEVFMQNKENDLKNKESLLIQAEKALAVEQGKLSQHQDFLKDKLEQVKKHDEEVKIIINSKQTELENQSKHMKEQ